MNNTASTAALEQNEAAKPSQEEVQRREADLKEAVANGEFDEGK